MSLLDSLGGNSVPKSNGAVNHRMNNMQYLSKLLSSKNINPRDLALNMINQNSNLNSKLREFLNNNGISNEQIQQAGINI